MIEAKVITYKQGELQGIESIRDYAATRYPRWLEYSTFQCTQAGIEDEAIDLLSEVIISLFQKDEEDLLRLFATPAKCGRYKELDLYVLRMIKLNCYSETAPYRAKNKPIPSDRRVILRKLSIIDEPDDSEDHAAIVLKKMRLVRWVFNGLDLTDLEKRVFEYKFFQDQKFLDWPGPETKKQLYQIYNNIQIVINEVLYYKGLTNFRLIDQKNKKLTQRQEELASQFLRTHRVQIRKAS